MLVKMLDPNIAVNTELTTRKLRDETLEHRTLQSLKSEVLIPKIGDGWYFIG